MLVHVVVVSSSSSSSSRHVGKYVHVKKFHGWVGDRLYRNSEKVCTWKIFILQRMYENILNEYFPITKN